MRTLTIAMTILLLAGTAAAQGWAEVYELTGDNEQIIDSAKSDIEDVQDDAIEIGETLDVNDELIGRGRDLNDRLRQQTDPGAILSTILYSALGLTGVGGVAFGARKAYVGWQSAKEKWLYTPVPGVKSVPVSPPMRRHHG